MELVGVVLVVELEVAVTMTVLRPVMEKMEKKQKILVPFFTLLLDNW